MLAYQIMHINNAGLLIIILFHGSFIHGLVRPYTLVPDHHAPLAKGVGRYFRHFIG